MSISLKGVAAWYYEIRIQYKLHLVKGFLVLYLYLTTYICCVICYAIIGMRPLLRLKQNATTECAKCNWASSSLVRTEIVNEVGDKT